jgi:hypothetical protein
MKNVFDNKFTAGFIAGAAVTAGIVAAALATIKITIIDPVERHESWIEDNKKKANRKAVGR